MLNENGHEVLDDTPIALPLRFNRPATKLDDLRRMLGIISRDAQQNGNETFEEADDFVIGDDYDPRSPWELSIDQEVFTPEPVATGDNVPPVPGPAPGNGGDVSLPPQQEPPSLTP